MLHCYRHCPLLIGVVRRRFPCARTIEHFLQIAYAHLQGVSSLGLYRPRPDDIHDNSVAGCRAMLQFQVKCIFPLHRNVLLFYGNVCQRGALPKALKNFLGNCMCKQQ